MSTQLLFVTWPATPANAMMIVTAMQKTSVTMMESASSTFVWQTQSVMDLIRFVMLNMTTASTVDRMTALTTLMVVAQVQNLA